MNKTIQQISFAALVGLGATQANAIPVDAELSLVIDVSGSVSSTEYNLMMDGYAAAFRDSAIQTNILGGTNGGIAVNVVFFATSAVESIGYTLLDAATDIDSFADTLDTFIRPAGIGSSTGIAAGAQLAYDSLLAINGYESDNLIIDISGDGENNSGASPTGVRDLAEVNPDMRINGITIGATSLEAYYDANVVTSNGFTIHANSFAEFETGIQNKLRAETGGGSVPEPTQIILLSLGALGLFSAKKRK